MMTRVRAACSRLFVLALMAMAIACGSPIDVMSDAGDASEGGDASAPCESLTSAQYARDYAGTQSTHSTPLPGGSGTANTDWYDYQSGVEMRVADAGPGLVAVHVYHASLLQSCYLMATRLQTGLVFDALQSCQYENIADDQGSVFTLTGGSACVVNGHLTMTLEWDEIGNGALRGLNQHSVETFDMH